jgi:hypothetical protein
LPRRFRESKRGAPRPLSGGSKRKGGGRGEFDVKFYNALKALKFLPGRGELTSEGKFLSIEKNK